MPKAFLYIRLILLIILFHWLIFFLNMQKRVRQPSYRLFLPMRRLPNPFLACFSSGLSQDRYFVSQRWIFNWFEGRNLRQQNASYIEWPSARLFRVLLISTSIRNFGTSLQLGRCPTFFQRPRLIYESIQHKYSPRGASKSQGKLLTAAIPISLSPLCLFSNRMLSRCVSKHAQCVFFEKIQLLFHLGVF